MNSAQFPDMVESITRRPTANDVVKKLLGDIQSSGMANGGVLHRAGGSLVDGPGDGRSDHVVGSLEEPGDVRLSRGEYVVPADVVSALGQGSTEAGAERLNQMVEQWRAEYVDRVEDYPGPGENDG